MALLDITGPLALNLHRAETVLAILSAILAARLLIKLKGREAHESIKQPVVNTFFLIALGYICWAAAEIVWEVLGLIGMQTNVSIADAFWIPGYLLVIAGFSYFASYMYRAHGESAKGIATMAVIGIISFSIVYFLISQYIFGFQEGESVVERIFDYLYPTMSALILISTTATYSFFRKIERFGKYLLVLAITALLWFVGDMLWVYYTWNEVYGISGVISDSSYVIGYLLSVFAFYALTKRDER
jgi:hypothetical protein